MAKVTADEARLAAVILRTWCGSRSQCRECKELLGFDVCPLGGVRRIPTLDDLAAEKAEPKETLEKPCKRTVICCPVCGKTNTVQEWDRATGEAWNSNIPGIGKNGFMYVMDPCRVDANFVCPACSQTIEGSKLHPVLEAISNE